MCTMQKKDSVHVINHNGSVCLSVMSYSLDGYQIVVDKVCFLCKTLKLNEITSNTA